MIKPLRKRHLQIWTAIAILLPLGIIFSWLVIPNPVPIKILQASNVELLPVIHSKKDTDQYCINIRTNKAKTDWQLEWKNKLALTVPSAVIYKASLNPTEGGTFGSFIPNSSQLIGRIESTGDYVFPLSIDSTGQAQLDFALYDFIHEKVIDFITFKPPL